MMTREEFRRMFESRVVESADPESGIATIVNEGKQLEVDIAPHDPVLASKVRVIYTAIEDFQRYIVMRAESEHKG